MNIELMIDRGAAVVVSTAVALTLGVCAAPQLQGADKAPQVMIESKFVEISGETSRRIGPLSSLSGNTGVLSDSRFQTIVRALNQTRGVDILSAPRVTTRSKQRAVVEIIRDFRSAADWKKDSAGGWKPTTFKTKNVGVTLEVTPEVKANGAIDLRLKPSVVEFLGFIDLDDGKGIRAKSEVFRAAADRITHPDTPDTPANRRLQPIFFERKIEVRRTIRSGETVALSDIKAAASVKPFGKNAPTRKLLVFVSASLVKPAVEGPLRIRRKTP